MVRAVVLISLLSACAGTAPKCPDVAYGGTATDEVYDALKDAESSIVNDDQHAPVVSEPREGQGFSESALTVRWPNAPARHLPPVTGEMSWLRITSASKRCRIEVVTSEREATLGEEGVAVLKADKGTATVEVVLAYLQDNRIIEGPYRVSTPRTFTVK